LAPSRSQIVLGGYDPLPGLMLGSARKKESGGDTRMKSEPKLNRLQGNPRDTYIVLSNMTQERFGSGTEAAFEIARRSQG